MPQSRVRCFHNERTQSTPIGPQTHPLLRFRSVWVHLGPFRCCMKLGPKWAELVQIMQKFIARSRV